MAQNQAPQFLTVAKVTDFLHVSKMTVCRMVHVGELPATRVKRPFRVSLKTAEELSESNLDSWIIGGESGTAT